MLNTVTSTQSCQGTQSPPSQPPNCLPCSIRCHFIILNLRPGEVLSVEYQSLHGKAKQPAVILAHPHEPVSTVLYLGKDII